MLFILKLFSGIIKLREIILNRLFYMFPCSKGQTVRPYLESRYYLNELNFFYSCGKPSEDSLSLVYTEAKVAREREQRKYMNIICVT